MPRSVLTCVTLVTVIAAALAGLVSPVWAQRQAEIDPAKLTADQKELLNYAYLPLRYDLLPAIHATGDQAVVVRQARLQINYIVSLQRTPEGEARIQAGRPTSPAMVKFVLEHAAKVRDALSDQQRRAFTELLKERKLEPITVDASTRHFLLRYTFGPDDRVEKAKAPDGRILDVVVHEKEDMKQWSSELKTGAELIKVLENEEWGVRKAAGEWLIQHGAGTLDAASKKRIAELILTRAEKREGGFDDGWLMPAYSKVAQPEHEKRVFTLLDSCSIHLVAGMVAAYAAIAPAKALDYVAKPRTDKNYPIRAVQGLAMAPDGERLLAAARTRMPDMAWKIDNELKSLRERAQARAQGKPENPGLVELEARRKAEKEAAEKAREGKKPGEYQGFDDWFADLSSGDGRKIDKASSHFVTSVYAADLSTVKPQQRAAVFAIAHASLTTPRHQLSKDHAGKILVASADRGDTDALLAMIKPENGRSHYPLAALIRVNPDKAEQVLLAMENQKFSPNPISAAAKLAPAEAIPVLENAAPKLKVNGVRDYYGQIVAELKKMDTKP